MGAPKHGIQDPAERVALVLWERATGRKWSPGMGDGPSPTLVATAREWLLLFQAAGLAVVDQSSDADRMVLAGPLQALAIEWSRHGQRLRAAGGDAAVAAVFEQHAALLLEFLGGEPS